MNEHCAETLRHCFATHLLDAGVAGAACNPVMPRETRIAAAVCRSGSFGPNSLSALFELFPITFTVCAIEFGPLFVLRRLDRPPGERVEDGGGMR
jgi:hypothetical protein